jgi:hypothetical protein
MKGKYRRSIGKFYDKKMNNGTSNFGAMRNRIPGVKHITVAGKRLHNIPFQSSNPDIPAITSQSSRLSSMLPKTNPTAHGEDLHLSEMDYPPGSGRDKSISTNPPLSPTNALEPTQTALAQHSHGDPPLG